MKTLQDVLDLFKKIERNDTLQDGGSCGWISNDRRIGGCYIRNANAYENGCIVIDFAFENDEIEYQIEIEPDGYIKNYNDCIHAAKQFLKLYADDSLGSWATER